MTKCGPAFNGRLTGTTIMRIVAIEGGAADHQTRQQTSDQ
jgi:hypothetical protein